MGTEGGGQIPSRHMTSMRRNDVASTSFRRWVPIRFLINQCQIITFLILKYDIIENSRIELRGIVLPVQMGGLLGGQRVCCPPPPLKLLGGMAPLAPLFLRLCVSSARDLRPHCSSSMKYFIVRNRCRLLARVLSL